MASSTLWSRIAEIFSGKAAEPRAGMAALHLADKAEAELARIVVAASSRQFTWKNLVLDLDRLVEGLRMQLWSKSLDGEEKARLGRLNSLALDTRNRGRKFSFQQWKELLAAVRQDRTPLVRTA